MHVAICAAIYMKHRTINKRRAGKKFDYINVVTLVINFEEEKINSTQKIAVKKGSTVQCSNPNDHVTWLAG